MKTFIDKFTGLYPVSKTLRFEARPVPATKKWLNSEQCSVLFNDITRGEYYPVLKELLDDYYRYYIEEALGGFHLDEDLIRSAFIFFTQKEFEKLESVQEKLRKNLVKVFDSRKDYLLGSGQLKDLVKLSVKKKKEIFDSHLVSWIKDNPKYSAKDRNKFFEAIGAFEGFVTYLGSYKQTRDNLFTDENIASSIAYRVVHENMLLYFSNIRIYEKIKESYSDLYEQIKKFERFFIPEGFAGILSQSQIDEYNYYCIGRPADDIDYKGVNILINEYRQKMDISSNELPCMAVLYKQILSDRETSFLPEGIKDEAEAILAAVSGYNAAIEKITAMEELFKDNITKNNQANMYIKVASIHDFSKTVLGDWKILGETLKNAKYKGDVISLGNLLNLNFFPVSEFFQHELTPKLPNKSIEKVSELKKDLDNMLAHIQKYKPFYLFKGSKPLDIPDNGLSFANEFRAIYESLTEFISVYNKIRNFATKKPYSMDKIKLNFDNPTLLAGWDLNRESSSGSYIFIKDGKYYLGIADNNSRDIFSNVRNGNKAADIADAYYKVEYKQISGAAKMLSKVFFADKNVELYGHLLTDRIMEIKANKLYTTAADDKEALAEWIDFLKAAIALHPEWNNYFNFKFRDSSEYVNVNDFYTDVDNQAYSLKLLPIAAEYIDELVNSHKMYLFQLYNKDFSEHSKGKENLHTMYWKGIFSKENLAAIDNGTMPFIKLNGEAEMFMRNASIPLKITHPKDVPIANKNPLYKTAVYSVYHYDLIKDKRFTERKFFFHCPITLNYRAQTRGNFNMKINDFVADNPDINIIGIDRGERNLLYYTVINQKGEILEQGSLNSISHSYTTSKGEEITSVTDYHLLLNIKEKERNDARQSWGVIENIKELKAGYLSQAVHKICQLMLQYNAVVILENLDIGFKRGRSKVEKQVYQKFEKAMIDKLNYLVFKDRGYELNGSFGKGLQLAAPFESFSRIGKQTGCIYYVSPSYTSQIDPKTGFVNLLGSKLKYESISKAQELLKRFDSISYNASNDYFEIAFDYKNFGVEMEKTKWVVCTCGGRRPEYSSEEKKIKNYHVTTELKALFDSQGIEYADGKDILSEIVSINDKSFLEGVLFHLRLTLKMRYTGENPEDDFFLSPVEFAPGSFFDTREASQNEPQTADANDAYHIALKGLMAIQSIKDGKLAKYKVGGEKAAWFKYMQNQEFRKA